MRVQLTTHMNNEQAHHWLLDGHMSPIWVYLSDSPNIDSQDFVEGPLLERQQCRIFQVFSCQKEY